MFFARAIRLPKWRWRRTTGYPADARALETTQVLLVEKDGILALLKRQPELALRMLGSMSSHLRVLVEPTRRPDPQRCGDSPSELAR